MKKVPNPIDKHVGSRVRMRRVLLGMSQEKLGEALNLTFQQVQKYEKGTNRISAVHLDIFSRMTGVPMDYFFKGMPRTDDFVAPGFGEREQASLSDSGLKGLAEVVGRHIIENCSEETRRDVADAIRALENKLGS